MENQKMWRLSLAVFLTLLIFNSCQKEKISPEPTPEDIEVVADNPVLAMNTFCDLETVYTTSYFTLVETLFGNAWSQPPNVTGTLDSYFQCAMPTASYAPCCDYKTVYLSGVNGYSYGLDVFEIWCPSDPYLNDGKFTVAEQQDFIERVTAHANSQYIPCTGGNGGFGWLNPVGYEFSFSVLLNGSGCYGVEVKVHYGPTCLF